MALKGLCNFRLEDFGERPLEDDTFAEPVIVDFPFPNSMPAKRSENTDIMKNSCRLSPIIDLLHGSTTLGLKFKDRMIIAADIRGTLENNCIAMKNLCKISPYLVGTVSGYAADCRIWHRCMVLRCHTYESMFKRKLKLSRTSYCMAKTFLQLTRMGIDLSNSMHMLLA